MSPTILPSIEYTSTPVLLFASGLALGGLFFHGIPSLLTFLTTPSRTRPWERYNTENRGDLLKAEKEAREQILLDLIVHQNVRLAAIEERDDETLSDDHDSGPDTRILFSHNGQNYLLRRPQHNQVQNRTAPPHVSRFGNRDGGLGWRRRSHRYEQPEYNPNVQPADIWQALDPDGGTGEGMVGPRLREEEHRNDRHS